MSPGGVPATSGCCVVTLGIASLAIVLRVGAFPAIGHRRSGPRVPEADAVDHRDEHRERPHAWARIASAASGSPRCAPGR